LFEATAIYSFSRYVTVGRLQMVGCQITDMARRLRFIDLAPVPLLPSFTLLRF
jgi:hypothetical protein